MTDHAPGEKVKMTVSERTAQSLAPALRDWLASRLGTSEPPVISDVRVPEFGGLSSTSVLFKAEWTISGKNCSGAYVARMAPEPSAIPVFPRYDLPGQYELITQVARRCQIPLPALRWNEPEGGPLGTPFFVMDQVEGRVPLDNPPYVFGGWVLDASADERTALQRDSIAVLARLHAIDDPRQAFPWLAPPARRDSLRAHVDGQREYYRWALTDDGIRVPIIERSFDWLEEHWPSRPGADVLSWGDSRIGNIIYDGFTPAAILDWEMASIGPREIDVAWFIFLHRFFQDLAEFFEVAGLPDFLRRSDVESCYTELTGHELADMDFYLTYAALRHAIVMSRIKRRMIHFGEDEVPADIDDYVMHRASLDKMLDGTYRWD
ncbi:MAG TPA: phosphotransferase family protein [Streptosporangiaceae bacterium]|nr:phosphotransferase family protein [Streptosporangiaceae bacterium]